jgi:hypothetical protein
MLQAPVFGHFEDAYTAVLEHVGQDFEHVNAPRGNAARECLNVSFVLDDPRDRIVYLPARRSNIVFCYAEALWYLWGRDDLEMIGYYSSRIARASADGFTLTGTAYGPKLFHPSQGGGVGGLQSLAVREPKIGEEQVVESPPKVSGLALVRSFVGSEQGELQRGLAAHGRQLEVHLVVWSTWPKR